MSNTMEVTVRWPMPGIRESDGNVDVFGVDGMKLYTFGGGEHPKFAPAPVQRMAERLWMREANRRELKLREIIGNQGKDLNKLKNEHGEPISVLEREELEELRKMRRNVHDGLLPLNCGQCGGRGVVGHETEGPCGTCGGWTAKKRAFRDLYLQGEGAKHLEELKGVIKELHEEDEG